MRPLPLTVKPPRALCVHLAACTLLLPAAAHAQSLCEELHRLRPGETRREASVSTAVQAGLGWNLATPAEWRARAGGVVGELSITADRTIAVHACDDEGTYEVLPLPGGARFGSSLTYGPRSELAVAAVHAGYLFTGPALRYWAAGEVSALALSRDSIGVALGVHLGAGIFEWLAARVRPSIMVAGPAARERGVSTLLILSVSPAFLREHFMHAVRHRRSLPTAVLP